MHEVLQLMTVLTKDRRFVDVQLPPNSAEGDANMCEVIDRYLNKGRDEGRVTDLKNLIANTGMSLAEAMAALGIPEDERDKYAAMLSS